MPILCMYITLLIHIMSFLFRFLVRDSVISYDTVTSSSIPEF